MKNKLVIAMITTGLAAMSTGPATSATEIGGKPVNVENKMGRGPNCLGRGLCAITSGGEARNVDAEFSSELSINRYGNLVMSIARAEIPAAVYREQFQDDEFVLVDRFDLPREIAHQMGMKGGSYQIPEGVYPVQLTKTHILVEFDVQAR